MQASVPAPLLRKHCCRASLKASEVHVLAASQASWQPSRLTGTLEPYLPCSQPLSRFGIMHCCARDVNVLAASQASWQASRLSNALRHTASSSQEAVMEQAGKLACALQSRLSTGACL